MSNDPRIHTRPNISDLSLNDRTIAMVARDNQRREAFMAQYRNPPQPSLMKRLLARVGR